MMRCAPISWSSAPLQAYVCMRCGYTKFYVTAIGALDRSKVPGARVLRADEGTPYR
jgi:hypothetical protein